MKTTKPTMSFTEMDFLPMAGQQTRKAAFLAGMETVVPWGLALGR
jgi:hypothetical protein